MFYRLRYLAGLFFLLVTLSSVFAGGILGCPDMVLVHDETIGYPSFGSVIQASRSRCLFRSAEREDIRNELRSLADLQACSMDQDSPGAARGLGEPQSHSGFTPPSISTDLSVIETGSQYFDHGAPSAYEQLMLELINRARREPAAEATRLGISLNDGLDPGTITDDPKPPLAFHPLLIQAAREHSQWMLDTDTFSHTGVDATNPGERMELAGYVFSGSWSWGENLAWAGSTGEIDIEEHTVMLHESLFESPGHRTNICNSSFDETGLGILTGLFRAANDVEYNATMITQKFALSGATPSPLVLGVVYNDVNADGFYNVGEGISGVTVVIEDGDWHTVTSDSGGYALPYLHDDQVMQITFAGGGLAQPVTVEVEKSGQNLKVDLEISGLEYTLTYTTDSNGSIEGESLQIVFHGTTGEEVVAVPSEGYRFVQWSDGVQTAARTDANVTSDLNVTAFFSDTTPHGISVAWMEGHGLVTDGTMDHEKIGDSPFMVYEEWIAGTNPNDITDILRMTEPPEETAGGYIVRWRSVADRTYTIERSQDLTGEPQFETVATGIQGIDGVSEYLDETAEGLGSSFYRVVVEQE